MLATIQYNSRKHQIDLSKPIDISIPLRANDENVNVWYIDPPTIKAEEVDGDIISVDQGASVNFNSIYFNPHAHGTHTECVGHITPEVHSINSNLKQYFFFAELISVAPEKRGDDFVISKKQLQLLIGNKKREAIVIRTMPNTSDKKNRKYSHTNWPYLLEEAIIYLRQKNVKHLLLDLPSVDKEKDDGELLGHHAFWNTQGVLRKDATITELIYVPNRIKDGSYFLNLQIAPFENDASPSKPILYQILD